MFWSFVPQVLGDLLGAAMEFLELSGLTIPSLHLSLQQAEASIEALFKTPSPSPSPSTLTLPPYHSLPKAANGHTKRSLRTYTAAHLVKR